MKKILLYSLLIMFSCSKDAGVAEPPAPVVPPVVVTPPVQFNLVVSATEGGIVNASAGTGTGNQISGITNNGTTNQTISWTPTSTGTFYYQCSLHGGMVGTITIQ